jgi:uncharacterized SAM-binding protein YcdF (DUF218 family)
VSPADSPSIGTAQQSEMATSSDFDSRTSDKPKKRQRWQPWAIGGALVVFVLLAIFFGIGRWLVIEDPLQKAQSIVVLSGHMPARALEAAKLYKQGWAPEVWLTRSEEPGLSLKAMGISYVGEDFYNLRVLVHEGVPPEAIRVLPKPIVNTADEITIAGEELKPGNTIIIATSKAHTRRVRILWRKLSAVRGHAIVRAASDDPFDAQHWWRNTTDALDVVREALGVLNAWAGLLLHPAPG